MKRGDVYRATLHPRSDSEQRGILLVVVVSHDAFNMTPNWRSVNVVPVSTSAKQVARGPTAVPLTKGAGGLKKDSVALCHQVTTLDRSKLTQKTGSLRAEDISHLEAGIKVALDLP